MSKHTTVEEYVYDEEGRILKKTTTHTEEPAAHRGLPGWPTVKPFVGDIMPVTYPGGWGHPLPTATFN